MDFLGIGLPEIILVLVIGVIVIGPKRLPEVAAQVTRVFKQMRGYADDVTSELRTQLNELTREYEEMRKELDEVKDSAEKDISSVTTQVNRTMRDVPAIIESSGEAPKPEPPPRRKTTHGSAGDGE